MAVHVSAHQLILLLVKLWSTFLLPGAPGSSHMRHRTGWLISSPYSLRHPGQVHSLRRTQA